MASALVLPPASFLDDTYDAAAFVGDAHEPLAVIPPATHAPLYLWMADGDVLRIDVADRWRATLCSTSKSASRVHATFSDPSVRPNRELKCATLTGRTAVFGTGGAVQIVRVKRHNVKIDWSHCALTFPSDVIDVCAYRRYALVGLRSGRIARVTLGKKPHVSANFSYHSAGAVTRLALASESEFVVAYTNGDLILGDIHTMRPIRHFSEHQNKFMFGLGLCVDKRHRMLACGGDDKRVRVWSLDYEHPSVVLGPVGTDCVTALSWIPDTHRPSAPLPALAAASGCVVRMYSCGGPLS